MSARFFRVGPAATGRRLRPRRPSPWVAVAWGAVVWVGLASAVWRQNARSGAAPALAFVLGSAGHDTLALATAGTEELPPPRPLALAPPVEEAEICARLEPMLARREGGWKYLTLELREYVTAAAEAVEPWGRVTVASTLDDAGGAADWQWWQKVYGSTTTVFSGSGEVPHFIIGNGSRSGDGEIEATPRPLPEAGGTVVIHLVGDARWSPPTAAQCQALTELVDFLRAKAGMIPVAAVPAPHWPLPAVERAYNTTLPAWEGPPANAS